MIEPIMMIVSEPRSTIARDAALVSVKAAVRLVSMTRRQSVDRHVVERAAVDDAGVGDEDVEPAVPRGDARDLARRIRAGDIERRGRGGEPVAGKLGDARIDGFAIASVDHDMGAGRGHGARHRPAEPARGAGDHRDLAVE